MANIKLSEKVVADILTTLLPRGLDGLDITEPELVTNEDITLKHFKSIMFWLHAEGVCRFEFINLACMDDPYAANFNDTVLTSEGFEILGYRFPPAGDKTLAETANDISQGKSNYAGVGEFIGGILGGFTKSVSQ